MKLYKRRSRIYGIFCSIQSTAPSILLRSLPCSSVWITARNPSSSSALPSLQGAFPSQPVDETIDSKVVWLPQESNGVTRFDQMASGSSSALAFPPSMPLNPAQASGENSLQHSSAAFPGSMETVPFPPVAPLQFFDLGFGGDTAASTTKDPFAPQPNGFDQVAMGLGSTWLTDATAPTPGVQSWQQSPMVEPGPAQPTLDVPVSSSQPYLMENLDFLFGWDAANINPSRGDPDKLLDLMHRGVL